MHGKLKKKLPRISAYRGRERDSGPTAATWRDRATNARKEEVKNDFIVIFDEKLVGRKEGRAPRKRRCRWNSEQERVWLEL